MACKIGQEGGLRHGHAWHGHAGSHNAVTPHLPLRAAATPAPVPTATAAATVAAAVAALRTALRLRRVLG